MTIQYWNSYRTRKIAVDLSRDIEKWEIKDEKLVIDFTENHDDLGIAPPLDTILNKEEVLKYLSKKHFDKAFTA